MAAMAIVCATPAPASDRAAAVRGNPGQFFGPDEYPPEALRHREQGRVVAKLSIDAAGRVTDCQVVGSSGSTALDVRTCVIAVSRVTFTPATDRHGQAIPSSYTLPVRWVLPEPVLEERRSLDEHFTIGVTADDRIESCSTLRNGKPWDNDATFCRGWREGQGSALVRQLRERTGSGRMTLTLQRLVQFPGEPRLVELHKSAGHQVVGLRRATIDILPDGTPANEQIVEYVVGNPDPGDPIQTLGHYKPAAAPTKIEVLIASSFAMAP